MNILFVTTKTPLPMNDGHSLRDFNILRELARNHRIHLLSFVKSDEEYSYQEELLSICASVQLVPVPANRSKRAVLLYLLKSLLLRKAFVICKYDQPVMRGAISAILQKGFIDVVHLSVLPLGVYLDEVKDLPVVFDEHNVESGLLQRRVEQQKGWFKRRFFMLQQRWLECFEKDVTRQVDRVLACSQVDARLLQENFCPDVPVDIIPNGVDCDYFHPAQKVNLDARNLVFVGGLDWYPNLDALVWFDQNILPLLEKYYPDIVIDVIGGGVAPRWQHGKNFCCHGRVEDIRPIVEQAAAFIVPLRIGGGTRLKILNAMAMGKCVVSTSIGAEGLGGVNGQDLLLCDKEEDFAGALRNVLENRVLREQIGAAAVSFIDKRYRWEMIGVDLRRVYASFEAEK